MRDDAHNEVARGFDGRQRGLAHCFSHLHFVAHVFFALLAPAFAAVGGLRFVRVLDALGSQLLLGSGLDGGRTAELK